MPSDVWHVSHFGQSSIQSQGRSKRLGWTPSRWTFQFLAQAAKAVARAAGSLVPRASATIAENLDISAQIAGCRAAKLDRKASLEVDKDLKLAARVNSQRKNVIYVV